MCHVQDTKKDPFEKSLISLSLTQLVKSLGYDFMYLQTCPKVPKVTTLVTFGFSSLLLSLLSEGRYFQEVAAFAKTCIVHGPIIVLPQL